MNAYGMPINAHEIRNANIILQSQNNYRPSINTTMHVSPTTTGQKFTHCKLQLLNSFFTYNQPLGEFKEEIHRRLKQLDNPKGLFKRTP